MRPALFAAVIALSVWPGRAEILDLGEVSEADGIVAAEHLWHNATTDTVAVLDVRTDCGCTQAHADRNILMPGDTLTVHVDFNPRGMVGAFSKAVKIRTSSAEVPDLGFDVMGLVVPSAQSLERKYPEVVDQVRFSKLDFSIKGTGHPSMLMVRVYNDRSDGQAVSVRLAEDTDCASLRLTPECLAPQRPGVIEVRIDWDTARGAGGIDLPCVLTTGGNRQLARFKITLRFG